MRYRVIPYRAGSRGATNISRALGGMCLRLEGSRFRPRGDDVLINWGNTNWRPLRDDWMRQVKNAPAAVVEASNKLTFFRMQRDAGNENIVPRFWTRQQDIPDDAFPIVCRTTLAGHSGEGIVIAADRAALVQAPLYVEYIKKQEEFRIHVGKRRNGQSIIIDEQRKARRRDVPDENVNWQVRNHHNGFIYMRQDIVVPEDVRRAAIQAFEATRLDFGAVDVIYNARMGRAFVLEINTAPGLEGQTVDNYAEFFRDMA